MVLYRFCVFGLWLIAATALSAVPLGQGSSTERPENATKETDTEAAIEAIDVARADVVEALSKAPLGFRRILFVSDIPEGFAAYEPRGDNVFASGEPLIVYAEPIGVSWAKEGEEVTAKLVVDFEIRQPDGQVLAGQKGFGEFALSAREPPLDFMTHIKIDVTEAQAGSYILGLTLRDINGGGSHETDLPFEIR